MSHQTSTSSPLTILLPTLTPSQIAALPYPPGFYPGARDVKTSYGSMRVYEWGPEDGRKIMLVHGDATCAPLWKRVAEGLVGRGCRVIVFDLWGRGYSDSPVTPLDARTLGLQLLFAASSSPLPWCSEEGFSIVGFSLGGGIAMDFTASFPHLVRSVALLAPAGMIRTLPGVYEEVKRAVRERRGEGEVRGCVRAALGLGTGEDDPDPVKANAAQLVRWQFEQHEGFVGSFLSSLVNGPVVGQGEVWGRACEVLKGREGGERLVVVCGAEDGVVRAEVVKEDLDGMLGEGNYVFETVRGGHGFLLDVEACERVVEVLGREWGV